MKAKAKLKGNIDDLLEGLKAKTTQALAGTIAEINLKAHKQAESKLDKGLKHWKDGFRIHPINDTTYLVSISGQLAMWMEDGIKRGDVSESIKSGNRARINKAQGKDYVDVPITRSADSFEAAKATVRASAIRSADDTVVKFSDFKNKTIKEARRDLTRVKDIIKSVDPQGKSQTKYMTIRRLGPDSVWPEHGFQGVKILDMIEKTVEKIFENNLRRIL